jgi:uncharacterized protein (DUF433 family)
MNADLDANVLFSLKEAAVLSRLSEDKVRREVERKVIAPQMAPSGGGHRLLFGEAEVLFFAMLNLLSGTIEFAPPVRREAWCVLRDCEPVRLRKTAPRGRALGAARLTAWKAVYRMPGFRKKWIAEVDREWSMRINAVFTVNWDALVEDIGPRIDLYRQGLGRVREDDAILGGEPVFKGTRLAVRHIAGMRAQGESVERIVEDYPRLSPDDVVFAELYAQAHPPLGRPKSLATSA